MTDDSNSKDLRFLLDEILSGDDARMQRARIMLLALDEEAVQPLTDAFYAGVNEAQGVVLLDVVAEIGGFEALQLLEDVFYNGTKDVWQRWAGLGMARNGRADILDALFDWLQTGTDDHRRTALLALGYIGDEDAELALIHALHDPLVAPQAVRALEKRQSIEGLAAGYNTDDAHVWEMVTNALLNLGDAGALPLIDIMQNEHPLFYEKVLVSLQNLNRPEAKEVLEAGEFDGDGQTK
ncbi:MAG: HEAT repeat domain-containing protein [Chloroflexota bacterium]